jgi:hypothetical protein
MRTFLHPPAPFPESVAEYDPTPSPSPKGRGERGKWGDFATKGGKISPNRLFFSPFPLGKGAGGLSPNNSATLSSRGKGEKKIWEVLRHIVPQYSPNPLDFCSWLRQGGRKAEYKLSQLCPICGVIFIERDGLRR